MVFVQTFSRYEIQFAIIVVIITRENIYAYGIQGPWEQILNSSTF